MLLGVLFQLSLLVVDKVIEYRHRVLVVVYNLKRLQPLRVRHLLGVAGIGDWLVLIILQPDMPQLPVRNVLHVNPAYLERALPLILGPHAGIRVIIYGRYHLCDSTEVTGAVHREE